MSTEVLSGIGSAVAGVAESVSAPVASVGAVAESAGSVVQSAGSLADVGGNLANFGNDMHIPSLNKDIFSSTKPATLFTDFQDRPVFSKSILKETVSLAVSKEVFEAAPVQAAQDILYKETEDQPLGEVLFDFGIVSENAKEGDSEISLEVKEDLKLASNVKSLLVEVGFPENKAHEVTSKSLTETLGRRGLELRPRIKPSTHEEAKTETEENAVIKDEGKVKVKNDDEKEERKKKRKEETIFERKFVKDEYADEARRRDTGQAVETAFEKGDEPKSGEDIVVNMHEKPSPDEMSGLALELGQDSDGSYEEIVKELRRMSFDSKKEARDRIEKLIKEKPAVKLGEGKKVVKRDVKRVLMTFKNIISDQWLSPTSRGLFGE